MAERIHKMQLLQDTFIIEQLQVLSEGKDNGKMKIKGVFGRCNEKNNNGRIYPTAVLESQLAKVQPMISERRLCGELDHPQNDTVKLSNASHLITKLDMKGDELIGEAEILNTPAGLTAAALVNGGVKIGISSRGMGTLSENETGDKIVNEDFRLVTFDLVADPSTRGAYPGLSESTESQYVRETQSKLTKEGNFVTMLESKMRDAYQPFIEEAKLSKKQKKVMDTDKDNDIDAKDLKTLRSRKDEAMDSIRRDGHWHRIAGMVAEALGHELSEDYGKGYPKMGIKAGTPAAKKEANKRKKKVDEAYSDDDRAAMERAKDKVEAQPSSMKGPGWRDRMRIKAGKRAEARGDVQAARIRDRGAAGGDVGLRAKLLGKTRFGGAGSAAYAQRTQDMLAKKAGINKPEAKPAAAPAKVDPKPAAAQPKVDLRAAEKARQERHQDSRGVRVVRGSKGSGAFEPVSPRLKAAGYKRNAQGKLVKEAYKRLGSMLAEMFHLREDARLEKKLASARRQGKSTTATKEAHRMGKLAAGSLAAGNPDLAERQKKEGKAVKRGTLKRTSPSTVYGRA
jgi:hypothetical protein